MVALRRVLKILAWTAGALLLVLVALYLLRGALLAEPLARFAADRLSEALGGRFRLERVEGAWLTDVELVGLRTEEPPPEGALVGLSFSNARVEYDLAALAGGAGLDAIGSMTVRDLEVVLDVERPAAKDEEPPPTVHEVLSSLPRPLPRISVQGTLTIRTGLGPAAAREVSVEGGGERLDLLLRGIELPEPFPPRQDEFAARVEWAGAATLVWTSESALGGVALPSARASFDEDGGWTGRARVLAAGGALEVEADPDTAVASARGLDFARLPEWMRALAPDLPSAGVLRLDARADGWLAEPELSAEVEVRDAAWRDWRAHGLLAKGRWRGDAGHVARLEVDAPDARIVARDVAVEPVRPYLVGEVGRVDVDVPDAAGLLDRLGLKAGLPQPLSVRAALEGATGGLVAIRSLSVRGPGLLAEAGGTAELPPEPERWLETVLDLRVRARASDLETPDLRGSLTASGGVEGTLAEPVADLDVRGEDLVVEGRRVSVLALRGELRWPVARLEALHLESDAGFVDASGVVDVVRERAEDVSFSLDVADLAGLAALVPGAPALAGSVRGSGALAYADLAEGFEGAVRLAAQDLAIDGNEIGDAEIDATARDRDVVVARLFAEGAWGRVRARGAVRVEPDGGTARIDELEASALGRDAALAAPVRLAWGGGRIEADGIELAAFGGRIAGRAAYGDDLDVELVARDLDAGALAPELAGRIGELVVRARGAPGSPDLRLRLASPELVFGDRAAAVLFEGGQDERGVFVERLAVDGGDLLQVRARGALPLFVGVEGVREGEGGEPFLDLEAWVPDFGAAPHEAVHVAGVSDLALRVEARGAELTARLSMRDLVYREAEEPIVLQGESEAVARAGPDGVEVRVRLGEGPPLAATATIRSPAPFDWTNPSLAVLEDANLEGSADVDVPALAPLAELVDGIVRIEGSARARLELSGTLSEPRVVGDALVHADDLRLAGDLPAFQEVDAELRLEGRSLRIERFDARVGYSPIELVGGIDFPPGETPSLELRLTGDNALLVQSTYLRLRADVDVSLKGPLDALSASGEAVLTDVLYSQPMSLLGGGPARADDQVQLFSVREGPFSTMRFDIALRADETIRLENNRVVGSLSADLHLGGTGAVPTPEGRLDFRDLVVSLPWSRLRVDSGSVVFPPDDPFAPTVRASAHTRMQGYDLVVQVRGQVPDLRIFVSSIPPLPQEEAILLLTTGSLSSEYEEDFGGTAAVKAGSYVGSAILEEIAGPSEPGRDTLLDRLEFEVGRDVSRTEQPTIEVAFRVKEPFYIFGERDRYDEYNFGLELRFRFR